jgi:predicted Zn finger-like uncharacterized protein
MDITCKQCNATYSIPAHKLPKHRAAARCKRCGYQIIFNGVAFEDKPPAAPPAAPATPTSPAKPHDSSLLDVFPALKDYDPTHYDLGGLLEPNKKGRYKTGLNKFNVKILTAVKPTLDQMLHKDEQVMRIAGGTAYYLFEILLGNGVLTMMYNRYALVATNQRLVMINTNHRMTAARHYLFQIAYDEIEKVTRGWFRTSLSLTPKKGKRRIFTSMKRAFTTELLNFIKPRLDPQKTIPSETAPKTHLCPACYCALGDDLVQCPACQAAFKKPAGAALRSLVLPGWGDWYLGHRFLGCCEMVGSLIVWRLILIYLQIGGSVGIGLAVFLLVCYNGVDALLTRHMGKKGYILEKSQPAPKSHPQLAASSA